MEAWDSHIGFTAILSWYIDLPVDYRYNYTSQKN